jgi:hypothetical protein
MATNQPNIPGSEITFDKPVVKKIPSISTTVNRVRATWIDDGKSVRANIVILGENNFRRPVNNIILWDDKSSPDYATVGNWTQQQAEARLAEVLPSYL